jgi:hypothetical protein
LGVLSITSTGSILPPAIATYPAAGVAALTDAADVGVLVFNYGLVAGQSGANGPSGSNPSTSPGPGTAGGAGASFAVSGTIKNHKTIGRRRRFRRPGLRLWDRVRRRWRRRGRRHLPGRGRPDRQLLLRLWGCGRAREWERVYR